MKKISLIAIIAVYLITMAYGTFSYAYGLREHKGFYLRMQLGIADTKSKGTGYSDGTEMEVSGNGSAFRLDIGGAIKENLIIFGTLGGISISDPDIELNGVKYSTFDTTSRISDFGIGITYYFMPTNVYIGGSLNLAKDTIEFNSYEGTSDTGYGLYLNMGKEWWVSDNWGLGLAIFGYFGRVPDEDEGKIKNISYGLLFSATFN
ncbi:MAG: hypothetical protein ACMUIL_07100 [bacterium]